MTSKVSPNAKLQVVSGYSWQTGFIYVFNLIIGAGLLTLPKSFAEVGWVLGLISLFVLAIMSFITVTFITETMSLANAMLRYKRRQKRKNFPIAIHAPEEKPDYGAIEQDDDKPIDAEVANDVVENTNAAIVGKSAEESAVIKRKSAVKSEEQTAVIHADNDPMSSPSNSKSTAILGNDNDDSDDEDSTYDITIKVELGEMAQLFFYKIGIFFYYLSICLYLYGSSAVYAAAISKSLTTVVCGDTDSFNGNDTKPCKNFKTLSVFSMYRIMLAVFIVLICPFAYFEIKNTKLLQIFTTTYRWFSMISMIILALIKVANRDGNSRSTNVFVFDRLPSFFGVAVYAFMCQHSIPAVTTPITNKKRLMMILVIDFVCVFLFYVTILMSAIFGFPADVLQDVYTLNFIHPLFFRYLLQLFPVLTLSATFPVFSIVLRDNIKKLVLKDSEKNYGLFLDRILFSSIAIIPPLIVAFMTSDVGMLVSYTGTYAGAIIQYVVPTMLVYCGRRKMTKIYGVYKNKHRSPFGHPFWVYFVMAWYFVCLVFVTYNKITGK